jgi:hypothetical protein
METMHSCSLFPHLRRIWPACDVKEYSAFSEKKTHTLKIGLISKWEMTSSVREHVLS